MNGAIPFTAINAGAEGFSGLVKPMPVGGGNGNNGFGSSGTSVSIVVESRIALYSYEMKKWVRLRPLKKGSTTGPLNVPPGLCSSYGGRTKPSRLLLKVFALKMSFR